jgi:mono/diheme cytochrome c family protein
MKLMRVKLFFNLALIFSLLLITLVFQACTKKENLSPLAQKGKTVYLASCIACHNADPRVSGALGPDIAGSSKELLTARVLNAKYPAGYQPKRATKQMVAMPQHKNDIEALFEYLNSFSK